MSTDTCRYILTRKDSKPCSEEKFIEIGGTLWELFSANGEIEQSDSNYYCVSYACGREQEKHPWDSEKTIPRRAMTALKAVVRQTHVRSLWIDAFCIPFDEPARSETLCQMGAIYSQAAGVFAFLSEECLSVLNAVAANEELDPVAIAVLESDEWISRAWTYQELVNCTKIWFLTGQRDGFAIEAEDLLNRVGHAIQKFQEKHAISEFEFRKRYPKADAFQELIVDWKISPYLERNAYQVLSAMHYREAQTPAERYYAMIGALTESPTFSPIKSNRHPAEYFMKMCEAKGDYSFIYCAESRDATESESWRPRAVDQMQAIFPWHSYGDGQTGIKLDGSLELKGMAVIEGGVIQPEALAFLQVKFAWDTNLTRNKIIEWIFRSIRDAGFAGDSPPIELECGYFFPRLKIPDETSACVAIATNIQMAIGAPGLLLKEAQNDAYCCMGAGMFVGLVPTSSESVFLE